MSSAQPYALITGGSHGIGKAIALELAQRNINLLLVALPDQELEKAKSEILSHCDVEVLSLGLDLTNQAAPAIIKKFCFDHGLSIQYLVNNAGMGDGGLFENIPLDRYMSFIDLNNRAMISLTYLFLEDLKAHTPAYILNTSSIEATLPLPYKAVYTATKNFIYAFSLALNEELRGSGVKVSVLCPSSVITNEEGLVRYKAHGWRAKLVVKMPDEVAKTTINRMLRGKTIIIPGGINRFIFGFAGLLPEMVKMRILERTFRVYRNHHAEEPAPASAK